MNDLNKILKEIRNSKKKSRKDYVKKEEEEVNSNCNSNCLISNICNQSCSSNSNLNTNLDSSKLTSSLSSSSQHQANNKMMKKEKQSVHNSVTCTSSTSHVLTQTFTQTQTRTNNMNMNILETFPLASHSKEEEQEKEQQQQQLTAKNILSNKRRTRSRTRKHRELVRDVSTTEPFAWETNTSCASQTQTQDLENNEDKIISSSSRNSRALLTKKIMNTTSHAHMNVCSQQVVQTYNDSLFAGKMSQSNQSHFNCAFSDSQSSLNTSVLSGHSSLAACSPPNRHHHHHHHHQHHNHNHNHNHQALRPIGIFWDIENVQVPALKSAGHLIHRIRKYITDSHQFIEREFLVVCDTQKFNGNGKVILDALNDSQVTIVHVNAIAKNAADDKLKQCIQRFVHLHGSNSALLIITGDINFAPVLADLRNRIGVHVILLHSNAHHALLSCADQTLDFKQFSKDLPLRLEVNYYNRNSVLLVSNLPGNKVKKAQLTKRLSQLCANTGGKLVSMNLTQTEARVKFGCLDDAKRAQQRIRSEDVFGNRIHVDLIDNPRSPPIVATTSDSSEEPEHQNTEPEAASVADSSQSSVSPSSDINHPNLPFDPNMAFPFHLAHNAHTSPYYKEGMNQMKNESSNMTSGRNEEMNPSRNDYLKPSSTLKDEPRSSRGNGSKDRSYDSSCDRRSRPQAYQSKSYRGRSSGYRGTSGGKYSSDTNRDERSRSYTNENRNKANYATTGTTNKSNNPFFTPTFLYHSHKPKRNNSNYSPPPRHRSQSNHYQPQRSVSRSSTQRKKYFYDDNDPQSSSRPAGRFAARKPLLSESSVSRFGADVDEGNISTAEDEREAQAGYNDGVVDDEEEEVHIKTEEELDAIKVFAEEVVELLSTTPNFEMHFSKFIPYYHNYFARQCRLSNYGCSKLIELFEEISPATVEIVGQSMILEKIIRLSLDKRLQALGIRFERILKSVESRSIPLQSMHVKYPKEFGCKIDFKHYGSADLIDLMSKMPDNWFQIIPKDDKLHIALWDHDCMHLIARRAAKILMEQTTGQMLLSDLESDYKKEFNEDLGSVLFCDEFKNNFDCTPDGKSIELSPMLMFTRECILAMQKKRKYTVNLEELEKMLIEMFNHPLPQPMNYKCASFSKLFFSLSDYFSVTKSKPGAKQFQLFISLNEYFKKNPLTMRVKIMKRAEPSEAQREVGKVLANIGLNHIHYRNSDNQVISDPVSQPVKPPSNISVRPKFRPSNIDLISSDDIPDLMDSPLEPIITPLLVPDLIRFATPSPSDTPPKTSTSSSPTSSGVNIIGVNNGWIRTDFELINISSSCDDEVKTEPLTPLPTPTAINAAFTPTSDFHNGLNNRFNFKCGSSASSSVSCTCNQTRDRRQGSRIAARFSDTESTHEKN